MNFSSVDRSLKTRSSPPRIEQYSLTRFRGKNISWNGSGHVASRGFDARSRCTNASWHSLNVREKGKEEDIYVCKRKEKKGNSKKRYFELSRDVHRNPSGARFLPPSIAPFSLLFSRWLLSATVFREGLWFGTGWKREKEITWRQLETTFRCRTSPRAERRGCRMTLLGSSVIQMRSLQVS